VKRTAVMTETARVACLAISARPIAGDRGGCVA